MNVLKELSECFGPSGREDNIKKNIKNLVTNFVDEIKIDTLGNLIVRKRGKGKKLMFAAHMDEVGLIVTEIDKEGFIRFSPVGNVLLTALPGSTVKFKTGRRGIISFETTADFTNKPEFHKLFIDVGVRGQKKVSDIIKVGDMATFDTEFTKIGNRVIGKAMDDRIGCYALIKLIEAKVRSLFDLYFVFTVQEEVGLRGSRTSGYSINPDYAIAVDVTKAGDYPKGPKVPMKLGGGVAIKVKDQKMIASPLIRDRLVQLCKQKSIKYQYEVLETGTTDAAGLQLIRDGIPSGTLSIPTRYIHTRAEMSDLDDVKAAISLLKEVIRRGF
ncbi:MAG TPA: M42 family peptidase [bacterium (Candidatus Stahlbacteria)]|nr:M42 family peptidase [Candidatus Stahlbacteria bacterium]